MISDERRGVKSIVIEVLALSPTLQVYLARLWARGSLGREFLERGKSFKGKKFGRKFRGSKSNLSLLIRLGNEFLKVAYMNKSIEGWMESRYASNMKLPPRLVAEECCRYKGFRREMISWLTYLSRKVKKRLWARMKKNG